MERMVKRQEQAYDKVDDRVGEEDPLEKEMATHSNILALEIQWTEEPGGLQSMGCERVRHNLAAEQQQNQ